MLKLGTSKKRLAALELKCKIKLLTGDELEYEYNATRLGQDLFDFVASTLQLVDKEYYGLKFVHVKQQEQSTINGNGDRRQNNYQKSLIGEQLQPNNNQWLDLTKSIYKQTKSYFQNLHAKDKEHNHEMVQFDFCFKFYPADPSMSNQEMTRYFLFLQLRQDLQTGRLYCESQRDLAYIIACILQSELGDYDDKLNESFVGVEGNVNYVSQFKFVASQTRELEKAAALAHQSDDIRGLSPPEAEHHFLKRAWRLDTYGVDPFSVSDYSCSSKCFIGVNHTGILTFENQKILQHFPWCDVLKISIDGRTIIVKVKQRKQQQQSALSLNSNTDYDQHSVQNNLNFDQSLQQNTTTAEIQTKLSHNVHTVKEKSTMFGFKCDSSTTCHNLWKIATEHRYFFALDSSDKVPAVTNAGGIFNRSCKLRYTGKVERELLNDDSLLEQPKVSIKRTRSLILRSGAGATTGSSNWSLVDGQKSPWMNTASSGNDGSNKLSSLKESSAIEEDETNTNHRHSLNKTLPTHALNNYSNSNLRRVPISNNDSDDADRSSSSSQQNLPTEFNLKPNLSPVHLNHNHQLNQYNKNNNNSNKQQAMNRSSFGDAKINNNIPKKNQYQHQKIKNTNMLSVVFMSLFITLMVGSILIVFINEFDHESLYSIRSTSQMIKLRSVYLPIKKSLFDTFANVLSLFDSLYY